jgi:glycine cleavage system aminomethyltransferase T
MFSFEITISGDISVILYKVEQEIKKGGGTFVGTTESGRFSGKYKKLVFSGTIEGTYKVDGDKVTVTITNKTGPAPDDKIEEEIRKYFKEK